MLLPYLLAASSAVGADALIVIVAITVCSGIFHVCFESKDSSYTQCVKWKRSEKEWLRRRRRKIRKRRKTILFWLWRGCCCLCCDRCYYSCVPRFCCFSFFFFLILILFLVSGCTLLYLFRGIHAIVAFNRSNLNFFSVFCFLLSF